MKKGQTITLKINTQMITALIVAMLFAMAATMLLAVTVLSAKVRADNSQTIHNGPSFSVPEGYVLVPAGHQPAHANNSCVKPTAATTLHTGAEGHQIHHALVPYYYNSVNNQTINDNSIKDSNILNIDNSNNSGTINNKIKAEVKKKISKKYEKIKIEDVAKHLKK